MKEDRQFVTALARGLKILSCFSAHRPHLGTSEIARMTGLPQPTVWRLCHTLASLGYLVQDSQTEKLRVGAPVLSLGYAALATLSYADVMRPHLQQVAQAFSIGCSIAERHGPHMIYIDRIQGAGALLVNFNTVGSRVPVRRSAAGWAWLAGQAPETREEALKELAKQSRKGWREDADRISEAMNHYDKHGFVLSSGLLHPDWIAVAAPVRSADGASVLSITAGAHRSTTMDRRMSAEIGPELKRIAAQIGSGQAPPPRQTAPAARKARISSPA